MNKHRIKYSFAFVGANALISETITVGEVFVETGDWQKTYATVRKNNLLHKIKEGTLVREFREIRKRLSMLTPAQLQLLNIGERNQAQAMILVGIVQTYDFIREFIVEVVRNKYLIHDRILLDSDYQKFLDSKSATDESIETLSDKSKQKIKTVVLRILTQVGLLDDPKEKRILHPMLDSKSIKAIVSHDPLLLKCFFYSDQEIKYLAQQEYR
ncbi:MAG: DUF1819 family protein [bacterium]